MVLGIWWNPFCPSVRFLICAFCPWSVPRTKQCPPMGPPPHVCVHYVTVWASSVTSQVASSAFSLSSSQQRANINCQTSESPKCFHHTQSEFWRLLCFLGSIHCYLNKQMGCSTYWQSSCYSVGWFWQKLKPHPEKTNICPSKKEPIHLAWQLLLLLCEFKLKPHPTFALVKKQLTL